MGIKGKEQKPPLNDPRSPEEILADDLPAADEPDATEKTAIRFASVTERERNKKLEFAFCWLSWSKSCVRLPWDITATSSSLSYRGVIYIQSLFLLVCGKETRQHIECDITVCSFCVFGLVGVNLIIKFARSEADPLLAFCGEDKLLSDIYSHDTHTCTHAHMHTHAHTHIANCYVWLLTSRDVGMIDSTLITRTSNPH